MAKVGRPKKKRGPGRPKGKKDSRPRKRRNKLGMAVKRSRSIIFDEEFAPVKRGRGRPRKNYTTPSGRTIPRSVGMNKSVLRNVKKLVIYS